MTIRRQWLMSGLMLMGFAGAMGQGPGSEVRKLRLAILVAPGSELEKELPGALALQGRYELADPAVLVKVLGSHPLELTARTSAEDVSMLGTLLEKDYLLTVTPGEKAMVRLVHCATGKVLVEREAALPANGFLAAALVRECIVPTVNPADPGHVAAADVKEEMKYWREVARAQIPRSNTTDSRALLWVFTEGERQRQELEICAWERVLMSDPKDNEALLNAGVGLVNLTINRLQRSPVAEADLQMAQKGTELVEAAFLAVPNAYNAETYVGLIDQVQGPLRERVLKMHEFIVDHARNFPARDVRESRLYVLAMNPQRLPGAIEAAVAEVKNDPELVAELFYEHLGGAYEGDRKKQIELAKGYAKSKDAVVRFFAEFKAAEILQDMKDAGALAHFDRALASLEEAYAELPANSWWRVAADHIYDCRYTTCRQLGLAEEAKKTVLAAAEHFKAAGRFNSSVADMYFRAVTEALGKDEKDVKTALGYCEAYLAAKARNLDGGDENWARQLAEYRDVHLAKQAGETVPDFSALRLIRGTEGRELSGARMAAAGGKIWLAWRMSGMGGTALMVNPAEGVAREIPGLEKRQMGVAAVGSRVYFGGADGIYEVNAEGEIVRHYTEKDGLPWRPGMTPGTVMDVCAAGEELVFSFRNREEWGVGRLSPATGKIMILAPTHKEATPLTEPVYEASRVWYDAAQDEIVVSNEGYGGLGRVSWTYAAGAWGKQQTAWLGSDEKAVLGAISQGREALTMTAEGKGLVLRLKGCPDIELKEPYVLKAVEPAWDERNVYVPTYLGLFAVSRATGKRTWVAHETNVPAYAALVAGKRVYVITERGLCEYEARE